MKFIEYQFRLRLPYSSAFIRIKIGDFPLNLVELLNVRQRLLGNLALVVGVQIEEFPARSISAFKASTSGCSVTPIRPTYSASIDCGIGKPARPKMPS